jgi:multiple sugar transport system substrate-binding protein
VLPVAPARTPEINVSTLRALKFAATTRRVVAAAVCASLAALVAACGGGEGGGAGGHSLTIWNGDARPGAVAMVKVFADAYKKSHPDVQVHIEEVASPDLDTKLRAAERGGGTPDLVYTFRGYIYDWAAAGLTTPVDDVYTPERKANLVSGVLTPGTYQGKVYFVPNLQLQQMIFYRKDWFKQAGLEPPSTWDDVFHDAQVLAKPPERYGFLIYDKPPEEVFATDLLTSYGANIFGSDGNVALDDPKTVAALETAVKLAKAAPPGSVSKNQSDVKGTFSEGLGAMTMASTSTLGAAVDAGVGDKVGVVPLPTVGTTGTPSEAYGFAIPAKAENVEDAKGLLRTMLDPDVYEQASTKLVTGMLPILKSTLAPDSKYWTSAPVHGQHENLKLASEASKQGVIAAQRNGISPYYSAIRAGGVLNTMISSVISGTAPEDAAAKAADAVAEIVKRHGG